MSTTVLLVTFAECWCRDKGLANNDREGLYLGAALHQASVRCTAQTYGSLLPEVRAYRSDRDFHREWSYQSEQLSADMVASSCYRFEAFY